MSNPRSAITSMGIQPSNTSVFSKPCSSARFAPRKASIKARYSSLFIGQFMWSPFPLSYLSPKKALFISILSKSMIGALASKNESLSPTILLILLDKSSLVSGPLAITVYSSKSISFTSWQICVMFGWLLSLSVTAFENFSRSTAKALPAGTLVASAHSITSEPSILNSSFNRPAAFP